MKLPASLRWAFILVVGSVHAAPPPADLNAKLQAFAKEKEAQARSLVKEHPKPVSPQVWEFFQAAQAGDWRTTTNLYKRLENVSGQREWSTVDRAVAGPVWSTVLEVGLTVELYLNLTPRFTVLLAHDLNSGLPAGSVLFGGTDPGRCFPTAFCASHVRGDPYFTLTQNALADGSYLTHLRATYGRLLKMPSNADASRCFTEYVEDAKLRLEHDQRNPSAPRQVKPGEGITRDPVTKAITVSGQVSVMMINGLLTKTIFEANPEREFFVEESFPLDWMYPHLTPHGAILKINRAPVVEVTAEAIAKDRAFWSERVRQFLGTDFAASGTVKEACDFVDRVYVRRDLSGFKGNRLFLQSEFPGKAYSKLRSAIAGIYFWRINEAGRRANQADQQRMIAECDHAFRQAFALSPSNPEALFRYSNLLISLNRLDDAMLLAQTALKLEPKNTSFNALLDQLVALRTSPPKLPDPDEDAFRANPTNAQAGLRLMTAHVQRQRTNEAVAVLDSLAQNVTALGALVQVAQAYGQLGLPGKQQSVVAKLLPLAEQALSDPKADVERLQAALQTYAMAGKTARMEDSLNQLVKLDPIRPELWYDLGAILCFQNKTNAALIAVSNAVWHSETRLRRSPSAWDLRRMAETDARFNAIRSHPDFKKAVTR